MLPIVSHPCYSYPFPGRHRFPMEKFGLLHDYLVTAGIATKTNTFRPGRCKTDVLQLAHSPDYVARFCGNQLTDAELRRLGLPWSEALVRRSLISPNGTLLTAQFALEHGIACHLAGGTHHAHRDFGSGFCVFNDLAVAALALLNAGRARRVLIFDCDVHQGDGTAAILADTPAVYTCSIHCEKNFPVRKVHSDRDVGLPPGCGDATYLACVRETLVAALASHRPDLVLYDAGVDVYAGDPLGRLDVSLEAIRHRDRWVLAHLKQLGIATATVIGGGYDDDRQALARRHAIVVEEAAGIFGRTSDV